MRIPDETITIQGREMPVSRKRDFTTHDYVDDITRRAKRNLESAARIPAGIAGGFLTGLAGQAEGIAQYTPKPVRERVEAGAEQVSENINAKLADLYDSQFSNTEWYSDADRKKFKEIDEIIQREGNIDLDEWGKLITSAYFHQRYTAPAIGNAISWVAPTAWIGRAAKLSNVVGASKILRRTVKDEKKLRMIDSISQTVASTGYTGLTQAALAGKEVRTQLKQKQAEFDKEIEDAVKTGKYTPQQIAEMNKKRDCKAPSVAK